MRSGMPRHWRVQSPIGDNHFVMDKLTRRNFLLTASAATLAAAAAPSLAATLAPAMGRQRVFVGSGTPEGILAYDWNPATGELVAAGVAAQLASVAWIAYLF